MLLRGTPAGRLPLPILLRHSPSVTFAVALIGASSAAVAADSLDVELAPSGVSTRSVHKTAAGPRLIGVTAGVTRSGGRDLSTALPRSVQEPDLASASRLVVAEAGKMFANTWPHVRPLFEDTEIVWQVLLAGRVPQDRVEAAKLTGYP